MLTSPSSVLRALPGRWVALRGVLAAVAKALIQWSVPPRLPTTLFRTTRLPTTCLPTTRLRTTRFRTTHLPTASLPTWIPYRAPCGNPNKEGPRQNPLIGKGGTSFMSG